jgi:hypothetical protein
MMVIFFVTVLILALNILMVTHLTTKTVYDMDHIRAQHEEDIRSTIMTSCIYGTKYKPEVAAPSKYWDENSNVYYCNEFMKRQMENNYPAMVMRLGQGRKRDRK